MLSDVDAARNALAMAQQAHIPVHTLSVGDLEREAILACFDDGQLSGNSPIVGRFEAAFAAHLGVEHAIAVSSGTAALQVVMAALDLQPGDEVVVPSFSFAPCADMVVRAGGVPVFADCEAETFNAGPAEVEAVLTPATRAVLAVHMYGHPCDLEGLQALCDERALVLIEDSAQGLGASVGDKAVGGFGAWACFSFYANKLLTTGEGGMVVTSDASRAARIRSLRNHGIAKGPAYWHTECGYNVRMPALCAALGLAQLDRIEGFLALRAQQARVYRDRLAEVRGLQLARTRPWCSRHAHWAHTVVVDERQFGVDGSGLARHLSDRAIGTRGFYTPLHLHPAYRTTDRPLPVSERLAPGGLVLPSGNGLELVDVERVCRAIVAIGSDATGV